MVTFKSSKQYKARGKKNKDKLEKANRYREEW